MRTIDHAMTLQGQGCSADIICFETAMIDLLIGDIIVWVQNIQNGSRVSLNKELKGGQQESIIK